MTENQYHNYGLIAELLHVATFRIQDMAGVAVALQYLSEARNEFESNQPKAEETTEAGSDNKDPGSDNPGKVRKSKQRRSK